MHTPLVTLTALFLAISSCGSPEPPAPSAGGGTPAVSSAPPEAPRAEDDGSAPDAPEVAFDGFLGGARVAVLHAGETTYIVDLIARRTVTVPGRPVVDAAYAGDLAQLGVAPPAARSVARATRDGRRLVVLDDAGARVVDTRTGARVTSIDGALEGAALGDDDRVLVAWTRGELRVASLDDAWRAQVALDVEGEPTLGWHGRLVVVGVNGKEHVIDRATWSEWRVPGDLVRVTDDGIAVVADRGEIALWRVGEDAPPERYAGTPVGDVLVDASRVAWAERVDGAERESAVFHVVSRASHVERVVRGVGECGIELERLVSLAGSELTTDDTCSPGCPSSAYQPTGVVYDVGTGLVKQRILGEVSPPATDAWNRELTRIEAQTARLGATKESAVESPGAPGVYAFAKDGALALGEGVHGRVLVRLAQSDGAALPVFSPDGRYVVALGEDARSASIWDARTGERIYAFSPVRSR